MRLTGSGHRAALVAAFLVIAGCLALSDGSAAAQPGALSITAGGPYSGQVGSPVFFMSRFDLGGRPLLRSRSGGTSATAMSARVRRPPTSTANPAPTP